MKNVFIGSFLYLILFASCNSENKENAASKSVETSAGMELISNDQTGFTFENNIVETWEYNPVHFDVMYEGGGVAIGDVNGDGLPDVYFSGNMVPDHLYLNKGNLEFEDVTEKAGIDNADFWSAGVQMVDINADGHLDIYICKGGFSEPQEQRMNKLYVNQGDGTFIEQAEFRGIADYGYSVMANFFDADADGDLDVYVINRPNHWRNKLSTHVDNLRSPKYEFSDHLYINNGEGFFKDETKERGIASYYNYGLSITTADLNNDNLIDIYIANDYSGSDLCWINQGNGYFKDGIKDMTNHIAFYAMGSDIADLNNDGLEEIYTVEMLPEDYWRGKVTMAPMVTEAKFEAYFDIMELHYQYMHNNLQWNRGNGKFSEISQLAGVQKTDWSWSCLLEDFDNDGLNDIFVSNGYKRDMFDNDKANELFEKFKEASENPEIKDKKGIHEFLDIMPSNPLANYMFLNKGDWKFDNVAAEWGMGDKTMSNGSAVADLDQDGDLDLIINNVDGQPMLYKNKASGNNFIRIKLKGSEKNPYGLGAKVTVKTPEGDWYEQFKVVRGFFSSVEPIMHIGLGQVNKIDEIKVIWTDLTESSVTNVDVNQVVEVSAEGAKAVQKDKAPKGIFTQIDNAIEPPAIHQENKHKDFENQVLLPHRLSQEGPSLAVGDVNGDGNDDFYLGGATGFSGQLYFGQNDGSFQKQNATIFERDKYHEDVDAIFLDPDKDGDLDLYVVSGGSEFEANSKGYADRFYANDGSGNFEITNVLPEMGLSGGCVESGDFNGDGLTDLFIGGRLVPEFYPFPSNGAILLNTGRGFEDATMQLAPALNQIGMVTDAVWTDVTGDGNNDFVIVGEWMPIVVLAYDNGKYVNKTDELGLLDMTGWWFTVANRDLDGDGDQDLIVGNLGENYKHKASKDKPFHVYSNDFDQNGTYDVVLAKYDGDRQVPVRGRECTSQQLPGIKEKFPTYRAFAEADISNIIPQKEDEKTRHLEVHTFASYILENTGGGFKKHKMPLDAQLSTIRAVEFIDVDKDGKEDIILAGNMFQAEPETTRADASMGVVLKNNGNMEFTAMSPVESNLYLPFDIRNISVINSKNGPRLIVGSNSDKVRLYSF